MTTVKRGQYLTVGPLTGQVFLVRRWSEHADGLRVALDKVDVTEQFDRIAAERFRHLTDDEWLVFADGAGFADDSCPRCGLPRCEWNLGVGKQHRNTSS